MSGVEDMIRWAEKSLGWGEPNAIHRWYAKRNGSYFGKGSTPWCDMAITYWAYHSGNYAATNFGKDYAYTVWHAERAKKAGKWYPGTASNIKKHMRRGAIVFFDWGNSDSISRIDHVGLCVSVRKDGQANMIEANITDRCVRRVRHHSVIAGFFNPDYAKTGKPSSPSTPAKRPAASSAPKRGVPDGDPVLKVGSRGGAVKALQENINYYLNIKNKLTVDGDFGPATRAEVKKLQTYSNKVNLTGKLKVDGAYGPKTAVALRKLKERRK